MEPPVDCRFLLGEHFKLTCCTLLTVQEFDAMCAAVVMYCHSRISVEARLLFRAQDRNMTNGDFAWFTFRAQKTPFTYRPWDWYGLFVDVPADELPRRRRAFRGVKQVCNCRLLLCVVYFAQCAASTDNTTYIKHK